MPTFKDFFLGLTEKSYRNSHTESMAAFSPYYNNKKGAYGRPERCFYKLAPFIPQHITAVLDIGCANGKHFLPFTKLEPYGIDIIPAKQITWVKQPSYKEISVEHFTVELEKLNIDLHNLLIISNVTLLLLSKESQQHFFEVVREKGCKNFIFQEPLFEKSPKNLGYLELDEKFFIQKRFREYMGRNNLITFISMDIPEEHKANIAKMSSSLSFKELNLVWLNRKKIIRRKFWFLIGYIYHKLHLK